MVYWGMVSDNYLNYSAEPFKQIMQAALVYEGVGGQDEKNAKKYTSWASYDMPSLLNHSVDYAKEQMNGKKVHVVYIGNGDNVMNQYPNAGQTINSNDRIFVLTDGNSISMPDMTGWTQKDITAFSQLTGITIKTSGSGKVSSQSIEAKQPITSDSVITVKMK